MEALIRNISKTVVRKIVVDHFSNKKEVNKFESFVNKQINNPDKTIVKVLKFGRLSPFDYYYDMEKLKNLSNMEITIVRLVSDYMFNLNTDNNAATDPKSYNIDSQIIIKNGWKKYPTLMKLLKKITSEEEYNDLHSGNIMKTKSGKYKIIDLEGFF